MPFKDQEKAPNKGPTVLRTARKELYPTERPTLNLSMTSFRFKAWSQGRKAAPLFSQLASRMLRYLHDLTSGCHDVAMIADAPQLLRHISITESV
jgi:hypothetical protein